MKEIKQLEKIIKHIEDTWVGIDDEANDCTCKYCLSQEQATYLSGLRDALEIISNK